MRKEMAKIEKLIHCTRVCISCVVSSLKVSGLEYKCEDPPMAAFTGLVLSSCTPPVSLNVVCPRTGDELLAAVVLKRKELYPSSCDLETCR